MVACGRIKLCENLFRYFLRMSKKRMGKGHCRSQGGRKRGQERVRKRGRRGWGREKEEVAYIQFFSHYYSFLLERYLNVCSGTSLECQKKKEWVREGFVGAREEKRGDRRGWGRGGRNFTNIQNAASISWSLAGGLNCVSIYYCTC